MKISILTQPLGHNYGGLLQAYALQLCLKNMGCEVETLDRREPVPFAKTMKQHSINLARMALGRIRSLPTERKYAYIFRNLIDFRDKHLVMSSRITTEAQLREYYRRHKFDIVLVGSDQVWRPKYSPSLLNYYLDFLEDIHSQTKRLSYAASFGVDEWEYSDEDTRTCKSLLGKFNAVSVRERSAIDLCRTHLGITPEWVVDPTMLLGTADYEGLLSTEPIGGAAGKILAYVLDPNDDKQLIATRVASVLGGKLFSVKPEKRLTQVSGNKLSQCQYPKVETWLQGFRDAEYVVTDSFHGCVFAILFNKPFIVVSNTGRGLARFDSLLSMFGLEERLVLSAEAATRTRMEAPIDWERVNWVRHAQVEASKAFLRRHIFQD